MNTHKHIGGKEKAALFLLVLCLVTGTIASYEQKNIQASMFYSQQETKTDIASPVKKLFSHPAFPVQEFADAVTRGDMKDIEQYLHNMKGNQVFLHDARLWKMVDDIRIEKTRDGFFLALLAAKNDLFQPYFGFFNTKENRIIWGKNATGSIISAKKEESGFVQLLIKNTGPYPWVIAHKWKNKATGSDLEMISPHTEVKPGETTLLLGKEEDVFLLTNETVGFDVLFAPEKDEKKTDNK